MDWLDDFSLSKGLSWLAEGADEFLGYSSAAAGSADEWALFDTVDFDSIGASGISGPVSSFLDSAMDFHSAIKPYASKALNTYNAVTGEKTDRGLFGPASYNKVQRDTSTFGVGSFTAGKSQSPNLSINDSRVRDAWSRITRTNNPTIRGAISFVRPTISGRGPTTTLKSAKLSNKVNV
jgi:hypothetical protein